MTSLYFENVPNILYNGTTAKNITKRAKILDAFKNNATNFYPYVVNDDETAESIAFDYYDDVNYTWIIYHCNDIIDPYHDWYKNTLELERFIKQKYGSLEAAASTILYYRKNSEKYYISIDSNEFKPIASYDPVVDGQRWRLITMNDDITVSADTFSTLNLSLTEWQPIDAYTYELELNDQRKYIKLLNRSMVPILEKQLREIMNG